MALGTITVTVNTRGGNQTFTHTIRTNPGNVFVQNLPVTTAGGPPGTGSATSAGLAAGSYKVVEGAVPAGWVSNGSVPGGLFTVIVTVADDTDIAVVFSVDARGSLKIVKNATGGDGHFTFVISGGPQSLATQAFDTVGGTGSVTLSNVIAGDYTVTESTPPTGWVNTGTNPQTVTVPINGTGTATFTNQGTGTLRVIKNTVGGDGTFPFTATGTTAIAPFNVTTVGGTISQTFGLLTAGSYTVTEGTLPAGWGAVGATNGTVVVTVGTTHTLTFNNQKAAPPQAGDSTVTLHRGRPWFNDDSRMYGGGLL